MTDYRYDYSTGKVLIRRLENNLRYEILHKGDNCWHRLGPRSDYKDEDYCRAVFLGQGCWNDLKQITKEECDLILKEWGYSENPPSECSDDF